MIKSLRGRLFIGVTAIIILTGAIGGMLVYNWAFDEARELQDSVLIQLASLTFRRLKRQFGVNFPDHFTS
jgi:two-component system, OmpR family, sensor kinase